MKVRAVGKGVRPGKETAWDMDDLQIEICKVKQPSCLATIKVLRLMEVCQVLVIHEDLDGEGGSMEIVSLGYQSMDDCEEFSVVDVIVSFHRNEQLREVGTGMPVVIRVGLEEDSARGILQGVCSDGKGFGETREVEDRAREEELF